MNDIRLKLKGEFKNQISDGLKIYYSKTRPVNQIISFLPNKDNLFIWEQNENIIISLKEIPEKVLRDYELKEFDFNIMDFNDNGYIIIDYNILFDLCCIDLNELLKPYNCNVKHITVMYKDWCTVKNLLKITNDIIKEYYKKRG